MPSTLAHGAWRPVALLLLVAFLCVGCVSSPSEPLDHATLVANLESREVDPRLALIALEQAGWVPAFARCESRPSDRGSLPWWRERAIAFHPEVRRARRDLEVTMVLAKSAGSPESIDVTLEVARVKGVGTEKDIMATFDLLSLLGLGRSAQAQLLARAEVRTAYAMLEETTWRVMHQSDRTLHEVWIATEKVAQLTRLLDELGPILQRARSAAERGWIAQGTMARAHSVVAEIENERAMAEADLALRQALLATEAGLLPEGAERLDRYPVTWSAESLSDQLPPLPTLKSLLARRPALRRFHLEHAVADAAVANAAAERFPTLSVGPRLISDPMSTLGGLVAESAIAWPSAVDSRVDAAIARRTQAKEALEDALLASAHNAAAQFRITSILHTQVNVGLKARREAVDTWWHAAKGAFEVDLARFEETLMSAEARMRLIQTQATLQLELAHAYSELEEALGPPEPTATPKEGALP